MKGYDTMEPPQKVNLTETPTRVSAGLDVVGHDMCLDSSVLPVTGINTWWTYWFMDCLGSSCQDARLLHPE